LEFNEEFIFALFFCAISFSQFDFVLLDLRNGLVPCSLLSASCCLPQGIFVLLLGVPFSFWCPSSIALQATSLPQGFEVQATVLFFIA
jgi:hypothetical protein